MTTSSTTSSTTSVTTSSSKRLSGLISGLDTDTLVKNLSSGIQNKIDKVYQKKQLAVWKQENYRAITTALTEFQEKYLATSTSSSSIFSSSFFCDSSITNTSSCLTVSGDTAAAANMVVTGVSQLAKQASFTTVNNVSSEALTTGTISESWTPSAITGASITVNYDGTKYKLALDSTKTYTTVDEVVAGLNEAVADTDKLKGKLTFSTDGSTVTATSSDKSFYIADGTSALLSGLGLSKSTTSATSVTGTTVDTNDFYKNTIAAGSSIEFTIDGTVYSLEIEDAVSLSPDSTTEDLATTLQSTLTSAISANTSLSGILSATVDSSGNVSFSCSSGTMSITGGSENLLQGLGLDNGDGTYDTSGTFDRSTLVKTYLSDKLSGSTLTVSLDGISKKITFNESEKDQYDTAAGLATYLQSKLNTSYGSGNITVSETSGALSFTTTDDTSVFSITSSDTTGVLGMTGALHVYAGESNRIDTSKDLEDLGTSLATQLTGTTYGLTVNGVDFTFDGSTSLSDMIKTINNDESANVTISYSSTTDAFTVTADNGGADSTVTVSDLGDSNLATALFGTGYTVTSGQNAVMSISFNGDASSATTITRSSNTFTLDGVSFTLLSKTDSTVTADNPITFSVDDNTDETVTKITDFIDDYNALITSIYDMFTEKKPTDDTYDPLTEAQEAEMSETEISAWNEKAKQGLMCGDTLLSSLNYSLRSAMTDLVSSVKSALSAIGISTQDDESNGTLTIDEDALTEALANDPDAVAALFTSEDGIASRLADVMDNYIGSSTAYNSNDGLLITKAGTDDTTSDSLTDLIDDYENQMDDLADDLEEYQDRLYDKFTALEVYLNQMNSYASWFSSSSSS